MKTVVSLSLTLGIAFFSQPGQPVAWAGQSKAEPVPTIDKAGLTVTGNLTKESTPNKSGRPSHVHVVKLAANQTYTILARSQAFDSYLTLTLDGKVLAFDDDSGGGLDAKIVYRTTAAGEYRIEVSSFNRKLGRYDLSIEPGDVDSGKSHVKINGKLTKESPPNKLGRPSQVHDVKLSANQTYAITVNSTAFDTYLTLMLDGKVLATDDDSGGGLNSKIVYRAVTSGIYRVEVCSFDRKLGDYELVIRPTTESPLVVNPKVGPGGPKLLPPMVVGSVLTPAAKEETVQAVFRTGVPLGMPDRPKNENRYLMNLTSGKTYSIFVDSSHFAPEVVVTDPAGRPLVVDNAAMDTTFSVIQFTAKADGRFILGVRSSEAGPYRLRYRQGELSKEETELDQARKLARLGRQHYGTGRYLEAREALVKSLSAYQRAFPAKDYADGHPDLARVLAETGHSEVLTGDIKAGLAHCEEAKDMYGRAYKNKGPWLPNYHGAYCQLAIARGYRAGGEYYQAIALVVNALKQRTLLPTERRIQAAFFLELASIHEQLGQDRQALNTYQQASNLMAIQMKTREEYFERANAEANLGRIWAKLGETQKALDLQVGGYKKMIVGNPPPRIETLQATMALADLQETMGADTKQGNFRSIAANMARKLFTDKEYPDGHPLLATALEAEAQTRLRAGDPAALKELEEAHAMFRAFYSETKFPNGHADLARSYDRLGMAYAAQGDLAKGVPLVESGHLMREKVLKAKLTKRGHPELVASLTNLSVLLASEKRAEALSRGQSAWAMRNALARDMLTESTESSAMAFLATQVRCKDVVLSLTAGDSSKDDSVYAELWQEKSLFTRLLERRREALRIATDFKSSQVGVYLKKLQEVRQQIHVFMFQDDTFAGDRAAKLKELTASKEFLERQLASETRVRDFMKSAADPTWQELAKALPDGAVFLDFVRYQKVNQGEFGAAQYAVFIVPARGAVVRTELGDAKVIDDAMVRWRRAIEGGETSLAYVKDRGIKRVEPTTKENESIALLLSEKLWQPIASKLPAQTKLIWLAPDGDLARLPFPALPNAKKDGVLLESHLFAQVPHGPFLVKHLNTKVADASKTAALLTVGGVEYGEGWAFLEGAKREVEQINALAGKQVALTLAGKDATPARLAQELPKARIAHLATHGYFAENLLTDERSRVSAQLKAWKFGGAASTAQTVAGTRHPLVYSGLALAGANDKNAEGILTAEAIVDLPLDNLQLAVLSACETGLGEFTAGEGVQGLPRAFHIAGCRNVVVSLWKVNDTATAALMTKFYHELLVGAKTPLDAMHAAQLTIYRHPELIPHLAGERGEAEKEKALRVAVSTSSEARRAPTRLWAPFFLSGTGR